MGHNCLCSVAEPIKAYSPQHSLQSFSLSVEEKSDSPNQEEESDSEEQAKGTDSRTSSVSQPQRVALFPGMDPSALMVRLLGSADFLVCRPEKILRFFLLKCLV